MNRQITNLSLVNRSPSTIGRGINVSSLNDREAMGLPYRYVTGDLEKDLSSYYHELFKLNKKDLINLIENNSTSFLYRFDAGQMLS